MHIPLAIILSFTCRHLLIITYLSVAALHMNIHRWHAYFWLHTEMVYPLTDGYLSK